MSVPLDQPFPHDPQLPPFTHRAYFNIVSRLSLLESPDRTTGSRFNPDNPMMQPHPSAADALYEQLSAVDPHLAAYVQSRPRGAPAPLKTVVDISVETVRGLVGTRTRQHPFDISLLNHYVARYLAAHPESPAFSVLDAWEVRR